MIYLERLNGTGFVLNAELIRELESTPDTIITLVSGDKIVVRDPVDEVVSAVIEYKKRIHPGMPT